LFFFFILFSVYTYTINVTETKKITRISLDLGARAIYTPLYDNQILSVNIENVFYNKIPKQSFSNYIVENIRILNLKNNKVKLEIKINNVEEKNFDYFTFKEPGTNIFNLDLWFIDNKITTPEEKPIEKKIATKKVKLPKNFSVKTIQPIKEELSIELKEQELKLPETIEEEFDYSDSKLSRFIFTTSEDSILNSFASNKDVYISYPVLIKNIDFKTKKTDFEVSKNPSVDGKLFDIAVSSYKDRKYGYALKIVEEFKTNYSNSVHFEEIIYLEAYIFLSMYENLFSKIFLEQAFNKFNEALVKFPNSKRALHALEVLGKIYLEENFNYRALEVFEKAVNRYPNNENILTLQLAQAVSFLKLNQSAKSLTLFKKIYSTAVSKYNKTKDVYYTKIAAEAYFRLGDIYLLNNDYQKSIDSYLTALEVFSDEAYLLEFPNVLFNTAQSYFNLKNYLKSLEYFRSFIKFFPNHKFSGIAMNRIGECLHLLGSPEEQVKSAYLETTFRYPDTFGSVLSKLRLAANNIVTNKDKDLPQFLDYFEKVIKENQYSNIDIFAVILKGESLIKRGVRISDEDLIIEAIELWKAYIREQPLSSFYSLLKEKIEFALCELIELYSLKEDFYNMVSIYESDLDSFITKQNTVDTLLNLIEAYIELSLIDKAKESIQDYKKLKGNTDKNLYLINEAMLFIIEENYKNAYLLLNKIDISKTYPNYRVYGRFIKRHKAKYYYQLAKYNEANNDANSYIANLKLTINNFVSVNKDFLFLLEFKLALEHYRIKDFNTSKDLFLSYYETYKENTDNKLLKEALYYIAHNYFELKDFSNAVIYYTNAIKEFPTYKDNELSKYRICKAYISLKDKENALNCLNNFDKNSSSLWFNLAKEELNSIK